MTGPNAIQKFYDRVRDSLEQQTFVSLRLSGPTSDETAKTVVDVRLIDLRGVPHLSFVKHEARQDLTDNLPLVAGVDWIKTRLGTDFMNALLKTIRRDWQLHCQAKGEARLVGHKPTTRAAPSRSHDEARQTLLGPGGTDWLHTLGITDTTGRPRPSMADKYRQISRYVEILHHLAGDCGWTSQEGNVAIDHEAPRILKLADMGCGKGYLTFAAWHLFHRLLHQPLIMLGVEARTELVNRANRMAREIHAEGLEFIAGNIASAQLPDLDALIALHACNTATDDAIRRGIEMKAKLIVVAPCCHQALRPALGNPDLLARLLQHGLFKERLAEWLTDGLRTLFLEWAGYQTKVIEFVGSEHTPKNLMIAAVRKHAPFTDEAAKARILELKRFFEIQHHALDGLLR